MRIFQKSPDSSPVLWNWCQALLGPKAIKREWGGGGSFGYNRRFFYLTQTTIVNLTFRTSDAKVDRFLLLYAFP